MFRSLRRHGTTVLVAMLTAALTAAAPAVARSALDVINADKVDGKDAVGSAATLAHAAGKLVAHNNAGVIPKRFVPMAGKADTATNAGHAAAAGTAAHSANSALLDGLDSTAFQPHYARTIVVPPGATPSAGGQALRDALASITDASASSRYLIHLEPGSYSLGSNGIAMLPFVDIEGSGRDVTFVSCTCGGASDANPGAASAVEAANQAELRSLAVDNFDFSSPVVHAVSVRLGSFPRLVDVELEAAGNGSEIAAVALIGGNQAGPTLAIVGSHVLAVGSGTVLGLTTQGGIVDVRDTEIEVRGNGAGTTTGVGIRAGGHLDVADSTVSPTLLDDALGLEVLPGSTTEVRGTNVDVSGSVSGTAVHNSGVLTLLFDDLRAFGPTVAGVHNDAGSADIGHGRIEVFNSSQGAVLLNDNAPVNTTRSVHVDGTELVGNGRTTVSNGVGYTTRIGASQLEGAAVVNAGTLTCAGVYDEAYAFSASTCP